MRKTKADLEKEVEFLQGKLIECESRRIREEDPVTTTFFQQWGPALLLAAAIGAFVYFQRGGNVDPPGPSPEPTQTIESVTETIFPEMQKGYSETFIQAADQVKSGKIKTDKELFDFVQPALVGLRLEKQRPFDQIFQLSLPRGDDGSFAGKEAEVEGYLRRIAKSW